MSLTLYLTMPDKINFSLRVLHKTLSEQLNDKIFYLHYSQRYVTFIEIQIRDVDILINGIIGMLFYHVVEFGTHYY